MRPSTGTFGQQEAAGALTEYTLFGTGALGTADSDVNTVVLGTAFSTSVAGEVRGVRWQRRSGYSGAGDVALFSSAGVNLSGTRTVSGQTASGWQRMDFVTPYSISASTVYIVAARYISGGYYATSGYFTSAVTVGPIEGKDTDVSPNGRYNYSSTMAYPVSTFGGASYYVDVVFAA